MMLENKDVFRLLVFAFNCVTVLFIFLELIRYTHQGAPIGDFFNSLFGRFSDSREQMNQLMLTHLYLLIGCAFPATITFIILDGGFMDGELAVFAFSGVVFLGIGDSVAALYGKMAGTSRWRFHYHNKSQEGSFGLIFATMLVYYMFCSKVYPSICPMFPMFLFATIPVAMLEGWTTQFDNLVCPIFYYITLHEMFNYFMNL